MAPEEQCGTRRAVWHQRSSVAPEELCGTRGAVWHQRSSVAPEEQCGPRWIILDPIFHRLFNFYKNRSSSSPGQVLSK